MHDFQPSSSNTAVVAPTTENPLRYYIAKVKKDTDTSSGESANPIMVVVDVSDNKVYIRNLAVYGQDASKYTYKITEVPKIGYTCTSDDERKETKLDTDAQNPKELYLENALDVFNLKVYKSFGREYQDSDNKTYIEPIPENDFAQFFNDEYFNQLTFNLYRKSGTDTTGSLYKTIHGSDINHKETEGETTTWKRTNDNFDKSNNSYYYIFNDLPLTDVNGNYYTYWVEEVDGAQEDTENKTRINLLQ